MIISKTLLRISSILLAALMLVLLGLQCMPFWTMPACTCDGSCSSQFTADSSCEACSTYFKWCVNLDPTMHTGLKAEDIRDTSEEWQVSIQQYTWLPTFESTKGVTEYFQNEYNTEDYEFMVKDMATMPIVVFFFALIYAYFGFFKSDKPIWSIFPLIAGVFAVVSYLTQPIFQCGDYWQVHLGVAAAISAIAIIPTIEYIGRAIRWFIPSMNR